MLNNIHVRTTKHTLEEFDINKIVAQLVTETSAMSEFSGIDGMSEAEARMIASEVERRIRQPIVSAPLLREISNQILMEQGKEDWRRVLSRTGIPIYDAYLIDIGSPDSFEKTENANVQGNPETSHKKKADALSKGQYLSMLSPKIADKHLIGDYHIHDLEYFGTRSFCMDWDLRYFLMGGFIPDGFGQRASVAGPAMKAEVAVLHAVKILAAGQTNCAGGQGFMNFLTFLAPFMRGKTQKELYQLMQMFVYEMTQMTVARGGQIVFSSVQLSPGVSKIWRDRPVVYKGKKWNNETYGDYDHEVQNLYRALMQVMIDGDYWGKPFQFPKPEICIEPEFMTSEYEELYDLTSELTAKFGTPYFDNMIPEYRRKSDGLSCYQCCAYQFNANSDTDDKFDKKMNFEDGEHFSMGSWQVVSLNCPRAAYKANGNDDLLLENLKSLMDDTIEVFKLKRTWLERVIKANRIPFLSHQLKDKTTGKLMPPAVDFEGLVYTIGLVGVNEMIQYHTGYQLHENKESWKLALLITNKLAAYARELEKKHGITIALARTPAESVSQKFPKGDLLDYRCQTMSVVKGDITTIGSSDPQIYYSNGAHCSVDAPINIWEKVRLEQPFFHALDGGNIFHVFLGEKNPDTGSLTRFIKNLCNNSQIGYFACTRDMTICLDCNRITYGIKDNCDYCRSVKVDHLSRVTGYLQAVSGWNGGKRTELKNRKRYSTEELINF